MKDAEIFIENRRLASKLIGKQILRISRLLGDPDDLPSEINLSFEPLLIETDQEEPVFITLDEGKCNLIFLPYKLVLLKRSAVLGDRIPVTVDYVSLIGRSELSRFVPSSLKCLSKPDPELPNEYFAFCGLKLSSEDGLSFCIGSHLIEHLPIAGIWLISSSELSPSIVESNL